jgi:DNA polymerase-3 subunit alpha
VELILRARAEKPPGSTGARGFASLADFADRVDLRQVNRRGLECLIKVGALDDFGERGQLLAAVDHILAASASAHEAREIGQLTLFGDSAAEADDLLGASKASTKVSPKEVLEWEKELVGVYVSSHPLQKMTVDVMNVITHSTSEITEEAANSPVVIAGMITDVRQITTKKGDSMAFVRLEDLQGAVDVTVFPQLYRDRRAMWVLDKIIIVRGKVDLRNGRVSVLADSVQDYVEETRVLEDTTSVESRYRNGTAPVGLAGANGIRQAPPGEAPVVREVAAPLSAGASAARYGERRYGPAPLGSGADDLAEGTIAAFADENPFAGEEPDWFEPDRDDIPAEPASEEAESHAPVPGAQASLALDAEPSEALPPLGSEIHLEAKSLSTEPAQPEVPLAAPPDPPSSFQLPASNPPASSLPVAPRRTLRVVFQRSQSLEADRRRLNDLVEMLSSYQGDDRFEVTLVANGKARYQLEFPNNSTRICRELKAALMQRLGASAWSVDES